MTMLYTYILGVFLIAYHVQSATVPKATSHALLNISERLAIVVMKKCLINANQTKPQEVLDELKNLKGRCWRSVLLKTNNATSEHRSKHCHAHKNDIVKCINRFGTKLNPCLGPDEAYLKEFMVEGFKKYSNYFCDNMKVVTAPEEAINTKKCTSHFLANPENDPHKICFAKSKIFGDEPTVDVITKKELCRDLQTVSSCYGELFDEHCPDAKELKKSQLEMQKEGLAPCANVL